MACLVSAGMVLLQFLPPVKPALDGKISPVGTWSETSGQEASWGQGPLWMMTFGC